MALPFLTSSAVKRRDSIISVDLGGRTTKAIHLQKKADKYVLTSYALMDAPIYEKSLSVEMLSEHLKAVAQALDTRTKMTTLVIGVNDSIVRHAELPTMPVEDMRQVLKMNPKNYLQQDLAGHVFDCFIPTQQASTAKGAVKPGANVQRQRVVVGGAKRQLVDDLQSAIKNAGLAADSVVPSLIGPANAFEMAMPEVFAKENVALIDIGFRNTTISILHEGDLALNRTVAIGGDKLTATLAEAMGISYAEAEGIKVGMAAEVQPHLEPIVTTLGRELRASIDFFEHQHDLNVGHIYLSGGTSASELIRQMLQAELMSSLNIWNPASAIQPALSPQQTAELDAVAPQLTVAIGAAIASL